MSQLFKIINPNFFQILSSFNKDIYIDCLLLLEEIINEDDNFNIEKNIALNVLEKYFQDNSQILTEDDETEIINNNRQKALKIISLLKKNGWLGEEKISYNKANIHFFDYSIEMIHFLKKTINQTKPESIENIYSVYYLLKTFISDKNFNIFKEIIIITENLLIKLKILKANIYRFYNKLINIDFSNNLQNILEQLLTDYKKNFFDSSYYILKTTNNFFKYRKYIYSFLNQIENDPVYFEEMSNQLTKINLNSHLTKINLNSHSDNVFFLQKQVQKIKYNLQLVDKLITIIDQKNEQYVQIACDRILFFDNQKKNIINLLNFIIKLILNEEINYSLFFNFWIIKNLDELSLYKPRMNKSEILISPFEDIPEEVQKNLKEKKRMFLEKKNILDRKSINIFVQNILDKKTPLKASELLLKDYQDVSRLILIYLYSKSSSYKNIYKVQKMNNKVSIFNINFSDFLIYKV